MIYDHKFGLNQKFLILNSAVSAVYQSDFMTIIRILKWISSFCYKDKIQLHLKPEIEQLQLFILYFIYTIHTFDLLW